MATEVYKLLMFVKRRSDLSTAEFRRQFEMRYVPLCMKYMRGADRYFRRYIETLPDPVTGASVEPEFDVLTEVWFHDRAVYEAAMAYPGNGFLPAEVIAEEFRLFDRAKTRTCMVAECESELTE